MTEYAVKPGGTPKWTRDAALNDSDKSFTVPAGKVWEMRSVHGEIGCTGTVGNRSLMVQITNGTDAVDSSPKTASITATQYGVIKASYGGAVFSTTAGFVPRLDGTAPSAGTAYGNSVPLLLPGYVVRVYDVAAIDAAADDLTVVLHYIEYDA